MTKTNLHPPTKTDTATMSYHGLAEALRLEREAHERTKRELAVLLRKISHGCTDANCGECDR